MRGIILIMLLSSSMAAQTMVLQTLEAQDARRSCLSSSVAAWDVASINGYIEITASEMSCIQALGIIYGASNQAMTTPNGVEGGKTVHNYAAVIPNNLYHLGVVYRGSDSATDRQIKSGTALNNLIIDRNLCGSGGGIKRCLWKGDLQAVGGRYEAWYSSGTIRYLDDGGANMSRRTISNTESNSLTVAGNVRDESRIYSYQTIWTPTKTW